MAKRWTEKDVEFLTENYPTNGAKYCAKILGRTDIAVKSKANKLKIKSNYGKLLTTEEYKQRIDKLPLELLENYVNSSTKILHKCTRCSYQWKAIPNNILRAKGSGCPKCAGNIKRTHEEYAEILITKNIKVLDNYINVDTAIAHQCIVCLYKWETTPNSLISSCTGCSNCAGNKQKTTEEYRQQLSKLPYTLLEGYINAKTPIKHIHIVCGNIFKIAPDNLINGGKGCPNCAISGFQPTKPALLYFIYFEELNLHKIGVTNNLKTRRKAFGYTSKVINSVEFNLGKDALVLEKKLLDKYSDHLFNSELLKSGNTETLLLDSNIIEEINEHFQL